MNWQYLTCYMIVDVFCLVIAGAVALNSRGDSGSELQVRYFRRLIVAYFGFVVTDMIWAVLLISNIVPDSSFEVALMNVLNKLGAVFSAYFWFCYGESRLDSPLVYNNKVRRLAMIPLALVPVLHIIGALTGLNYITLEDGSVESGPIYLLTTGIGLLYLLAVTGDAALHYARAETRSQRRTYAALVAFMIAPVFASVFDALVPYMPVMSPCMLISIVFVFLSFQESRISSDALTGLNNRRRADEFLETSVAHADKAHPMYLFIIDMNRFKVINDTYGHLEGDHALQLMADALRKACAELDSFAARWGGDEFVMICIHNITGGPDAVAQSIQAHLSAEAVAHHVSYDLSCSIGYACCSAPTTDIDALVTAADANLYDNKHAQSDARLA